MFPIHTLKQRPQTAPMFGALLLVPCLMLLNACGSNGTQNDPNLGDWPTDEPDEAPPATGENAHGLDGFYVSADTLYDVTDRPFIMRGVNYPYAWFRDSQNTEQQFADIASTGSNTVRVVLANGEQWSRVNGDEVATIIGWAQDQNMVAMLEVHDATGWPQGESAAHPDTAVDYWLSDDIKPVIEGQEAYILINIANEPLGNFDTPEEDYEHWVDFHIEAIERLRDAGLTHTLVVDAPNWGQDWTHTMRDSDGAQRIFDADPLDNIVFSVHMYDVYDDANKINTYFSAFADKSLPLIVGEFAADHGEDGNVDQEAILAGAEAHGFGYLGWSWSGNSDGSGGGNDLSSLDIVENFDVNQLSPWGESLIESENGIRATSETCHCFH